MGTSSASAWSHADWIAVATALILLGQLVVFAATALFARKQVGEARRLREAEIRPFVVVDAVVRKKHLFLEVANTGSVPALDVKIEFNPPLESSLEDEWQFYTEIQDTKIFREGIPTLVPGRRYRGLFDNMPSREATDLPDAYSVKVTYKGPSDKTYSETSVIDLGLTRNLLKLSGDEAVD